MTTTAFTKQMIACIIPVLGCVLIAAAFFTVSWFLGLLVSGAMMFFLEYRFDSGRLKKLTHGE